MKETLELLEKLIADNEYIINHCLDEMDKEVHREMLNTLVVTWFMTKAKLW